MEIVGLILYGLWKATVWSAKMFLYFLYFTLPVWFCFAGFFIGGAWGSDKFGGLRDEYIESQQAEFTHLVTVVWDETDVEEGISRIYVREDLNWSILGMVKGSDYDNLYYAGNVASKPVESEERMTREGYTFLGLFEDEFGGGKQYVSAGGYSLLRVTENITLYAIFAEVE